MTLMKKTITIVEVTTPGDKPGAWITKTTQTTTTEEVFPADEWPNRGRFGPVEGITEGEIEDHEPKQTQTRGAAKPARRDIEERDGGGVGIDVDRVRRARRSS